MSLQVNLLKKTERRYQGIVSMKVMALGSVSLLAGITILVFSMAGISKMTLKSNLDRARREWGRLNPQAAVVRSLQTASAANRKVLSDLGSWAKDDQPAMFDILYALQSNIPAQMALENFYAGLEQASDTEAYYTLRFSGRAQGELTAVDARRRLNAHESLRRFCGEIKLVSSQRETGDTWIFALEGRRLAEEGK